MNELHYDIDRQSRSRREYDVMNVAAFIRRRIIGKSVEINPDHRRRERERNNVICSVVYKVAADAFGFSALAEIIRADKKRRGDYQRRRCVYRTVQNICKRSEKHIGIKSVLLKGRQYRTQYHARWRYCHKRFIDRRFGINSNRAVENRQSVL